MKVFVTGGAGVIGSELVPILVGLGHEVIVGDVKARPSKFHDSVTYLRMDLNDLDQEDFSNFGVDVIFHLAATFERSTESLGFWEENYRHNVQLSHHVVNMARYASTVKRLVFASSYLIYDPSQYLFSEVPSTPVILAEGSAISPRNLVGVAKLYHEAELRFLAQFDESKFTSVSARIFRGYGKGSRDVISRWVRSILKSEPVTVFRPEGLFDYIFAADTAEALVALAFETSEPGPVNVGSGQARSVAEILEFLGEEFPSMKVIWEVSQDSFEASQSSNALIGELTQWKPRYSLEQGIKEIIEFERARLLSQ